ncbi:MAG: GxxExxY protein [Methylococcaceae bacterium]
MNQELLYRDECYQIQGAIFEVYREMGCGFLEAVYQECLAKEFALRKIPYVQQQALSLYYKGKPLQHIYIPDFVCYQNIIVELKAISSITGTHQAQVLNYLKASKMRLGLLVNFGSHPKATIQRIIL